MDYPIFDADYISEMIRAFEDNRFKENPNLVISLIQNIRKNQVTKNKEEWQADAEMTLNRSAFSGIYICSGLRKLAIKRKYRKPKSVFYLKTTLKDRGAFSHNIISNKKASIDGENAYVASNAFIIAVLALFNGYNAAIDALHMLTTIKNKESFYLSKLAAAVALDVPRLQMMKSNINLFKTERVNYKNLFEAALVEQETKPEPWMSNTWVRRSKKENGIWKEFWEKIK